MNMEWLATWWRQEFLPRALKIVRHPWHSIVSLFARIGDWTLSLIHFVAVAGRWVWRQVRRLAGVSLWGWTKGIAVAFAGLCVLGIVATLLLISYPTAKTPDFQPVDQHVYLSQGLGWTGGLNEPLRQLFYYTPQGAAVKDLRYSWFVNLEVPWGKTKFADPQRMSAYGFLVDSIPTTLNPDRLPVGFTSHYDSRYGEKVLDLTCAACHTGELTVNKNGKRYGLRIDGGPAMHAFTAMHIGDFGPELLGSLASTYLNPFKFTRFARAVLGPAYPQARWKLHHDLGVVMGALLQQSINDKSRHLYPTEEGPGRIDALGRIGNTVFGDELSTVNYKVSNAPVRYPPLWDIWKFDFVQYNASVRQPMTRNVSESMGTGATASLLTPYGTPIPVDERFDSSVAMNNLNKLETALWSLEPPKWNESCMGTINWESAQRGQALFGKTCAHCHGPFPASEPIKEWFAYLKTARNKCSVINGWQSFLNDVYAQKASKDDESDLDLLKANPPGTLGVSLSGQERQMASSHHEGVTIFAGGLRPLAPPATPGSNAVPNAAANAGPATVPDPAVTTTVNATSNPGDAPPPDTRLPVENCTVGAKGGAPQVGADYDLPLWVMHPLPVEAVGTDPTAATNFIDKQIDLTKLGLVPSGVETHLRQVMRQDLFLEINAYIKDMLRLTGTSMQGFPLINQWTQAQAADYQKKALDIVSQVVTVADAEKKAANEQDAQALLRDISAFKTALYSGASTIDNVVDSLDLSSVNTGQALSLIVIRARQRFYAQRRYEDQERNVLNGFGQLDIPRAVAQYKPRPLAGIWAAGPFLHNGSVPTIYQLLLPADRRDKKFFVGTRDFDAVNLGLSTQPPMKGGFWLDTSITGNSNIGHEFRNGYVAGGTLPQYGVIGPEWSEQDRRDILEYLKVHRDTHTIDSAKDMDGYLREGLDTNNVCQ